MPQQPIKAEESVQLVFTVDEQAAHAATLAEARHPTDEGKGKVRVGNVDDHILDTFSTNGTTVQRR